MLSSNRRRIIHERVTIPFSRMDFGILCGSFNEICNGFSLPDFEAKTGVTKDVARVYMESLQPIRILVNRIKYQADFPEEYKKLKDGYTAYWDETSSSVVFENQNKQVLVYQPQNGKDYFDSLKTMEFAFEDKEQISILTWFSLFEIQLALATVREVYHYLNDDMSGDYHVHLGAWPEEGESLMAKLQNVHTCCYDVVK